MVLGQARGLRVGLAVLERAEQREPAQQQGHPHVQAAQGDSAQQGAEAGPQRLDVAHQLQLPAHPGTIVGGLVFAQLVARAARLDRGEGGVGGQHAGLDRVVAALDARQVHEARRAADQRPPRERQLGHRLIAALGDRPRPIGNPFRALEIRSDLRVMLQPLEFLERRQPGVGVIEVHDKADGHVAVAEMVHERAAAGLVVQRPAEGVLHQAGLELLRRDLPQLLQPDAVLLRLAALGQAKALLHDLRQRPARALGQQHIFAVQLHARLVVGLVRPVLADAEHPGDHALDGSVIGIDQLRSRHAGIDLHPQSLSLLAQPAAEIGQ